jgi:outer membrane protein assembly factor BamB
MSTLRSAADEIGRCVAAIIFALALGGPLAAEDWPRWRGPAGMGVSTASRLPLTWSRSENIRWRIPLPGEGSSSPIVSGERVFLTAAHNDGLRRVVLCLDVNTGRPLWSREIEDENPELTSALTGHAAATPVSDGERVYAAFGNAGVVCYTHDGEQLWRRTFGEFDSELGLATSPILYEETVILVCDHDGHGFRTFDSFVTALDRRTGATVWKTDRPGLERSWSTPIVISASGTRQELIVNAQDELRAYHPAHGELLWSVRGMTGWVTPSPVFSGGLIYACSGRDGPTMGVRPGGRGDVTETHVVWSDRRGAPYVCSPIADVGWLYVHNEQGILTGYEATSGTVRFRQRLRGRFVSSGVIGAGRLYVTSEEGTTYVLAHPPTISDGAATVLATNHLGEECLTSPAVSGDRLLIRTRHHLWCLAEEAAADPPPGS